jgi:hypothetical protein
MEGSRNRREGAGLRRERGGGAWGGQDKKGGPSTTEQEPAGALTRKHMHGQRISASEKGETNR